MKKRLLVMMVALFATSLLFSQQFTQKENSRNGTPKFLKLDTRSDVVNVDQANALLTQQLNLSSNDDLVVKRTETDDLGYTHQRYQQYYKGLEVVYGDYIVHSKNGIINAINGDFRKFREIDINPSISEDAALKNAIDFIGANSYMWEIDPAYSPQAELVIVQDDYNKHPKAERVHVLAYKFDIYATNPLSRDLVYVDAKTGKIVHKNALIKNVAADGQGDTRYSGNKTFKTDSYNGSYRMRDYTRGNGIIVYDMNKGTNYSSAIDFTDADNNWTAAEYHNSNKDDIAAEAMWAYQKIYDYWMNVHNRDSYDGNGALQKVYVHYDNAYDNAYWNGSVFTFGDGSDTYFDALASLDVSAHEHGHALCSHTCNLTYSYESGALNEAFSDIWGAALEAYAAPEKDIWIVGEDIERRSGHDGLRVMSNPKAEGLPDTYQGQNWYTGSGDNGGVHYNNGPFCYWFYLISEGGAGTNDNGDAYNVAAIGINKAEKIAYRVEAHYMTSSSDYADARTYVIQAAKDLYGEGSQEEISVTDAMYAIGVGAAYSGGGGGATAAFCESKGNNSSYEWIAQVQVGSYSNSSNAAGYTDFTSEVIDLNAGSSYNITLTPGFASTTYNEYWKIWIDFNNDTTFGADELVFDAGSLSKTAVSGTISIPSDVNGTRRMRVSMKYNAAQDACEAFSYGEVEDYNVNIVSGGGDTQAPTIPGSLTASDVTYNSLNLAWAASTDNVGVTGYDIYRNGAYLTTTTATSYAVTGLSASTAYSFYVKAKDAAGNVSAASNTVNVTTNQEPDTQAPTAPTSLASSNITQVSASLSWTASTDNVGVVGYDIYKDGALLATTASTSYGLTNLLANTSYNFFVKAKDAAGNVSAASNTIAVTTLPDGNNCNASPITLNLTFDNYASETSWTLKDANGSTLYSGSNYSANNTTITEELILDDGDYTFTINDSYGDGICCSYGNGSYELVDNNGVQIVNGGSFGSSEATNFCISGSSGGGTGGGEMPTGYCDSKGNNATYEWIDLVQLGSINNSTANNGGYADFTNLSTDVVPGSQYTINFSCGFKSSSYTEYWHVYIDYNRDGDFSDAGEEVVTGSSSSSGTLSGTFTVPATASIGTTKMRVTMKYNAAATPCETFSYGEVEDYAINIAPQAYGFANLGNIYGAGEEIGYEDNAQITLFPVPVQEDNIITIAVSNGERNSKIQIYNIYGGLVKETMINGSELKINVSDLPSGNYILKMEDPKEPYVKAFIK